MDNQPCENCGSIASFIAESLTGEQILLCQNCAIAYKVGRDNQHSKAKCRICESTAVAQTLGSTQITLCAECTNAYAWGQNGQFYSVEEIADHQRRQELHNRNN